MENRELHIPYEVRLGTTSDFEAVAALFSSDYSSDLTSRDPESFLRLTKELEGIKDGSSILAVAVCKDEIVGAGIAVLDRDFSKYEPKGTRRTAYLSKNVVRGDFRRLGIGRALVAARLNELRERKIEVAYSSHHSDNIGSARALDALGFEYVESYLDAEKRPTGSRMTTVRRVLL